MTAESTFVAAVRKALTAYDTATKPSDPAPEPDPEPVPTPTPTPDPPPVVVVDPTIPLGAKIVQASELDSAARSAKPGDTVVVHGGTIGGLSLGIKGAAGKPIKVMAYPGETVLSKGLGRFSGLEYVTLQGLSFTWDGKSPSNEHLVRFTGGTGWQMLGCEVYDSHSYAGVHVTGDPAGARIAEGVIRDTVHSNDTNQDHLIYFSDGTKGFTIERMLLLRSPNGRGVKIGSAGSAKTNNVTIRYCTMVDNMGPSNVQMSYYSDSNVVDHCLMVGSSQANVTGYNLSGGKGGTVRNSWGWNSDAVLRSLIDGGGNTHADPKLDSAYKPAAAAAKACGRYAS